jgi:hypothetical protein
MKNRHCRFLIMAALAVVLLAGCKKDKPTLNVSDSEVTGTWRKNGTNEFWCYRGDHTGCKYNTDEGFSEEFPSYTYEWSVSEDQLRHVTYEQGVPITRTYTITAISSSSMEREEEVGTYNLTKI